MKTIVTQIGTQMKHLLVINHKFTSQFFVRHTVLPFKMNTNLHANKMVMLFGFHIKNSPLAEYLTL